MRKESPLHRILQSIVEDHIAHIQEEIVAIKTEINNLNEELQALEFMSENNVITKEMFPNVMRQHMTLIKRNKELMTQMESLHNRQEEFTEILDQTYPSQGTEVTIEELPTSISEKEELYILREIRNFYIENDDYENTLRIADEIKKLRSK